MKKKPNWDRRRQRRTLLLAALGGAVLMALVILAMIATSDVSPWLHQFIAGGR